jgi:hypothetical protein
VEGRVVVEGGRLLVDPADVVRQHRAVARAWAER